MNLLKEKVESCEHLGWAPVLVMTTVVLKQYGAVCVLRSVASWINMCVSCPHVAVTQFSGSETWLHCQGELSGGHYGPVFAQSSFAGILGCFYSPSFSPAALDIFFQMLPICFSVNPKPTNVHRDKGAVVL